MKFDRIGQASDYIEPLYPLDPLIYTLRKERYTQNVSQKELARRVGCTKRTINAAENGATSPNFYLVMAWAKALGFKLELTR